MGTCGWGLGDLLVSPDFGASQLSARGVVWKERCGVEENDRRLDKVVRLEEGINRAWRAVQMPLHGQWEELMA